MQTEEGYQPVFFDPRPLKNLLLIDEMESLSPIMDLKARAPCPTGCIPTVAAAPICPWLHGASTWPCAVLRPQEG